MRSIRIANRRWVSAFAVAAVIALWRACDLTRRWNPPERDIELCRQSGHGTLFVAEAADRVVGSIMVGHDGHRGWVYYVAVDPDFRHKGYGRVIMDAAENWLRARGIEKLQLMVRPDNSQVQAFYQSLGYLEQERIVYAKWLDRREPTP